MRRDIMRASVAVGIACAVRSIYYPTHTASWVFDDLVALALNRALSLGLTWPGVGWAFTTIRTGNWFPLTWLTHMLDVTLYGWHAWGAYHLTNILLHQPVPERLPEADRRGRRGDPIRGRAHDG